MRHGLPHLRLWIVIAAVAALGAIVIVLGATLPGAVTLGAAAVGAWTIVTMRLARSIRRELRPGEAVRLSDGTVTPSGAGVEGGDRMGSFLDSAGGDFGGGGGGGDGGGGGGGS